jgi:hypothetical protein
MANSRVRILSLLFTYLVAVNVASPQAARIKPPYFTWTNGKSETKADGKLSINIGGKKSAVASYMGSFQLYEKSDFKRLAIPPSATCAGWSWYAGGGDQYYIVVNGGKVFVKKSYLQEVTPDDEKQGAKPFGPWKTHAIFSLSGARLKK